MKTPSQQLMQDIIEKLHIKGASREVQEKIVEQVGSNIFKRITLKTVEALPDEARDEYVKLTEAGDADALMALIEKHIPEYDALVKNETDRVMEELQEKMDTAK
jgi:hypothetical protein